MVVDLTKLILHSNYPGFKNNIKYTGSFLITGTATSGVNVRTITIDLDQTIEPDLIDVLFAGPNDSFSGFDLVTRPDDAFFNQGYVAVKGDEAPSYVDYPTLWVLNTKISGNQLIVTATYVQTFIATLTLTPAEVFYQIVDYSVF